MLNTDNFKCGFVAIIGKPNVGKSSLMNRLLGEKISITSSKPQTTRLSVKGIYNNDDMQVIFLDTPGYLKPRYEMQKRMLKQLTDSLKDADVVLFIADASDFPTDYDNDILEMLRSVKRPLIAVFNKSDLAKSDFINLQDSLKQYNFDDLLRVSAKTGESIEQIIPAILKYLPLHAPFYDTEQLSDLPMRFFAQEIIRESVFRQFGKEIPYATAVLIDKYEELPDKSVIQATVWIERDSQKPIIIGKNGTGLQKIREYAEKQMTEFMGCKAELHLWVKVKKNWRKNNSALRELGFRD